MIILGINTGYHNSSVALLQDENVLFHIENERLSNIKYDKYVFQAIDKVKDYVDHIDHLVLTGFEVFGPGYGTELTDAYIAQVYGLNKTFLDHGFNIHNYFANHHETHAATAFYNSGFDKALCIVLDGVGSPYYIEDPVINPNKEKGWETKSTYIASYPYKFDLVEKYISSIFYRVNNPHKINNNIYLTDTVSEAILFEYAGKSLGFTKYDAGKVMGLAPYGSINNKYPSMYKDGYIDKDNVTIKDKEYQFSFNVENNFKDKADFAFMLQKEVQESVAEYVIKMIEKTKEKNVCLSGGFFLNCVSNYNLLKQLPKDVKIYVEPISTDAGNAIGAAKQVYYNISKSTTIKKQKTIYYGPKIVYDMNIVNNLNTISDVSPGFVAELIAKKNIVAIFQGSSEAGPRALGNRSILYDPRDPDGKDHVNSVKMRESFRPFAGTVLQEYAEDWFDLQGLEESKFMMFAVDVLKDKQNKIPAITHIDGTCRVQTLRKEDNQNYYELIEEFYKITDVPILFNTSLNLAGDAINETLEDAINTFNNSKINYLYLPDLKILVIK
jgi:carbamoyltransferase